MRLTRVTIPDEQFCFLLDFLTAFDGLTLLRELRVEQVRFNSNERVSERIRGFIEGSRVKILTLQGLGLKSREFCVMCLGVGSRKEFDLCSFPDNFICELALKCLEVLMKFHKETLFDLRGNPIERILKSNPLLARSLAPK